MAKFIIDLDTAESYTLEIAADGEISMDQLLQMLNYGNFIEFDGLVDGTVSTVIFSTNHIVSIHQIRGEQDEN